MTDSGRACPDFAGLDLGSVAFGERQDRKRFGATQGRTTLGESRTRENAVDTGASENVIKPQITGNQ
ncbi:MAG: hypothetical protein KAU10_09065, partial [Dehalococcoidia bacterium]|nr:hypothetical protein [Dehalococcoidia bacterium]